MTSGALNAPRAQTGVRPCRRLTPQFVAKVCQLVEQGVPQAAAAGSLGIPRRTFQEWLAKGREDNAREPYASLAEKFELALDRYHTSRVKLVSAGAEKDPRLAQWELERRFKDDWGDPRRGDVGITVNLAVIQQSPEWAELRDRALEALARHPEALADYLTAIGGDVVEGEAVELAEIEAA